MIIEFLKNNYQWIFGGIGVSILGWVFHLFSKRATQTTIKQNQKAGDNSANTQIGQINK